MNIDNYVPVLVGIIAAAPGVLALILGRRRERAAAKVAEADYADKISKASLALIPPMEQRIASLEVNTKDLRVVVRKYYEYINYLLDGVDKLIKQLQEHRIEPEWVPEPLDVSNDKI